MRSPGKADSLRRKVKNTTWRISHVYKREEAAELRKLFWTAYGRYMTQHISARGPKISWLNYKTGIRQVFFRLHADNKLARVSIDIQHKDYGLREVFYEQFWELETLFHSQTGYVWQWEPIFYLDSGQPISRIFVEKEGINVYRQDSWAEAFQFFESIMVPLDELWTDFMEIFLDLQD